jgi:hypothetical protein
MNRSDLKSKGFASTIILILITIVIIAGSTYLYIYSSQRDAAISGALSSSQDMIKSSQTLSDPATRLAAAKLKVATEKVNLKQLIQESDGEQAANAIINNEYLHAAAAVNKTDILFNYPDSPMPQFKIKSGSVDIQKEIETQRLLISHILYEWRISFASSTLDIGSPSSLQTVLLSSSVRLDPNLIRKADDQIVTVQQYLQQLEILVDSLTPSGSGLTVAEINEYKALADEAKGEIDDAVVVMKSIESSLQSKVVAGADQASGSTDGQVTAQEIDAQEQALHDAQAEQTLVESEIAQAQATSTVVNQINSLPVGLHGTLESFGSSSSGEPTLIQGDNKN